MKIGVAVRVMLKTVKWCFIVFCVYLGSLFFRDERLPGTWVEPLAACFLPTNLVLHVESVSYGFRHGVSVRNLRLYDSLSEHALKPVVSVRALDVNVLTRRIDAEELVFSRLSDGYYRPGNYDRDERVEAPLPDWGRFSVRLVRPDILGICPETLEFDVDVRPRRVSFSRGCLVWPDREKRMALSAFCTVDLDRQEVYGEVDGLAKVAHIRPLILTLDVPVALPYMDGFTDVPEPCPAWCAWKVDLVRGDFDLWLDLKPTLGKYNAVPMRWANGKIHLHNETRDNWLNYVTEVGPIRAEDTEGRPLDGTVVVTGERGTNTVTVKATSMQPLADVLKIGGFTGDYVGSDVCGRSECDLLFRFPRAMSNNYEVLNGRGHVTVRDGHLMRMKGFSGLIKAMPAVAPAVTWFSDSTQASCDYTIENGVVRTENGYVEGTCFSIKMAGAFDTIREELDFTVLVQFAKSDSVIGKILHPIVWPFSKLLLEFRLTGSPEDPQWKYVTVLDRVVEAVK